MEMGNVPTNAYEDNSRFVALKKEATFIAPHIKHDLLYEFFIKHQLLLT